MIRWMLLVMLVLSGCLMSEDDSTEAITALTCDQVEANALADVTCVPGPDGLLLQAAPGTQVTLTTPNAEITFNSTIFWAVDASEMRIMTLDGVGVLRSNDSTRIVSAGSHAVFQLASDALRVDGPPSAARVTDGSALGGLPLDQLTRTVDPALMRAASTPRPAPTTAPAATVAAPDAGQTVPTADTSTTRVQPVESSTDTPTAADCTIPPDWTGSYTVQRGDTLIRIADLHGVTLEEIISANCLDNPDRITAGETLAVPTDAVIAPTDAPADDSTPSTVFNVDRDVIIAGDCTVLRWEVSGARAVSLDGEPVAQSAEAEICPLQTTTYSLLVTFADGGQQGFTVTVTVTE